MGMLEIGVGRNANSSFRAWSTLALFDYVQDNNAMSAEIEPDPSAGEDQNEIGSTKESVRTELQKLLQRAYVENWKARVDEKEPH